MESVEAIELSGKSLGGRVKANMVAKPLLHVRKDGFHGVDTAGNFLCVSERVKQFKMEL